jgi:hypothetical protein
MMKKMLLNQARIAGNNQKGESKLPPTTVWLMLGTTVFIDLLQMGIMLVSGEYAVGEILNDVLIDTTVQLGFYIWFKIRGVTMANAQNGISYWAGFLGTEVDQGAIPLWTLEIGAIIFFTKAEEKVKADLGGKKLNN